MWLFLDSPLGKNNFILCYIRTAGSFPAKCKKNSVRLRIIFKVYYHNYLCIFILFHYFDDYFNANLNETAVINPSVFCYPE